MLNYPYGVALDASANLYIADTSNKRIRKVDGNGNITTVAGAGNGVFSGDGGAATNAILSYVTGLVMDSCSNLYIADTNFNRIRKVDVNGIITTVAGTNVAGYSGDGGAAVNAELSGATGVAMDAVGGLYIADKGNSRIRKVDTNGIITTVAGTNAAGFSGRRRRGRQRRTVLPLRRGRGCSRQRVYRGHRERANSQGGHQRRHYDVCRDERGRLFRGRRRGPPTQD